MTTRDPQTQAEWEAFRFPTRSVRPWPADVPSIPVDPSEPEPEPIAAEAPLPRRPVPPALQLSPLPPAPSPAEDEDEGEEGEGQASSGGSQGPIGGLTEEPELELDSWEYSVEQGCLIHYRLRKRIKLVNLAEGQKIVRMVSALEDRPDLDPDGFVRAMEQVARHYYGAALADVLHAHVDEPLRWAAADVVAVPDEVMAPSTTTEASSAADKEHKEIAAAEPLGLSAEVPAVPDVPEVVPDAVPPEVAPEPVIPSVPEVLPEEIPPVAPDLTPDAAPEVTPEGEPASSPGTEVASEETSESEVDLVIVVDALRDEFAAQEATGVLAAVPEEAFLPDPPVAPAVEAATRLPEALPDDLLAAVWAESVELDAGEVPVGDAPVEPEEGEPEVPAVQEPDAPAPPAQEPPSSSLEGLGEGLGGLGEDVGGPAVPPAPAKRVRRAPAAPRSKGGPSPRRGRSSV